MQVRCEEKWKWLLEFSWADGCCSSWSVLAVCGFLRAELAKSCVAWGICLLFSEPLFLMSECQHINTRVPCCSGSVVEVPHPWCAMDAGPAPKSIRMSAGTHARGVSCCRHGYLPVLSGLENSKEGNFKIAWALLVLQELCVAVA